MVLFSGLKQPHVGIPWRDVSQGCNQHSICWGWCLLELVIEWSLHSNLKANGVCSNMLWNATLVTILIDESWLIDVITLLGRAWAVPLGYSVLRDCCCDQEANQFGGVPDFCRYPPCRLTNAPCGSCCLLTPLTLTISVPSRLTWAETSLTSSTRRADRACGESCIVKRSGLLKRPTKSHGIMSNHKLYVAMLHLESSADIQIWELSTYLVPCVHMQRATCCLL